jgi:microcystin degradation protein MlrC
MNKKKALSSLDIPLRKKTFHIGVISFFHETCTYCPQPARLEDWLKTGPATDNLFCSNFEYINGFEQQMQAYTGVKLTGIISPAGMPFGGTSLSWNLPEVWDHYIDLMKQDIMNKGPFDGIFLALHGSMAVKGIARPEARLAQLVRKWCGPDIIIIASFDLHACLDQEIVNKEAANAVISVKRYPHFDTTLTGKLAADVMIGTLMGTYKPVVAVRKPGIITPSFFQSTFRYPAREIMERARQWENRETDVYVSINFGFAYADVPDNGASIFVVTNNNPELAKQIADDMNQFMWRHREAFVFKEIYSVKEGVKKALSDLQAGRKPVVIADGCDRTGGATWIAKELIEQKAKNFLLSTITDPELVQLLREQEKKAMTFTGPIQIGGRTDKHSGEPLSLVNGLITYIDEKFVVIEFGENNIIIISSELTEVTSPDWHEKFDIAIEEVDIFVHKSRVHFFRGYYETGIAGDNYPGSIIKIAAPGWGPTDMNKIHFLNGGQYLYPLDKDRKIGGETDRPYISEKDIIYQTGDGRIIE